MEAKREPGMIHVKAMCIIANGDRILATKGYDPIKGQAFFRLIGGGVHFCETSDEAIRREIKEELETELENLQFLEVVQNIFTHNGIAGHEVVFLYSGQVVRTELHGMNEIQIADSSAKAVWVPIADVLSEVVFLTPALNYSKYLTM